MTKTQNNKTPMGLEPMVDRNARRFARAPRSAGLPSVLCFVSIAWALGAPTDPRGTILRQELQIIDKKLPGAETDPRRDVHVFVEVSPVQPRVAGGIFFVIDVGNDGSGPVELADITDGHIAFYLWNADGVPVDLPDEEGNSRANRGGGGAHKGMLPEHVKAAIEQRRPFVVMKPDLLPDDPEVKSIESIKDGKIRLEAGEHFQVQVLVTKVLAEPEKWQAEIGKRSVPIEQAPPNFHPPDPPKIARIGAGTYTLRTSVSLFVEGQVPWSASSERVTVRLGPPADEAEEP